MYSNRIETKRGGSIKEASLTARYNHEKMFKPDIKRRKESKVPLAHHPMAPQRQHAIILGRWGFARVKTAPCQLDESTSLNQNLAD